MNPATLNDRVDEAEPQDQPVDEKGKSSGSGRLIINADDWGRDRLTTDRTLDCVRRGTVSSVSAMVFMDDSQRAAVVARDHGIDAGLHLNFTTPFSESRAPSQLLAHQRRLTQYLRRRRFSQIVFHPGLMRSFEYAVAAQCDEFARIYGHKPERLDGHHHMHLCANVLVAGLLPPGSIVRRNFSFHQGEKGFVNRLYRRAVDRVLGRNHQLTDFFFSIQPLASTSRLQRIFNLSSQYVVEVETHPQDPAEHAFLTGDGILNLLDSCAIARRFDIGGNNNPP